MKSTILAALLGLSALCLGQLNAAPYDPSQVTLAGSITDMSLDAGTDLLRGGTISIDGALVIVPANSLVTLPAATVAWPELFDGNKPQLPGTQTWKANVFANRVDDKLIAGLVFIAQDTARLLQGFITSIDRSTGHFTVHGTFNPGGAGGVDCVINDPLGVYGLPYKGGNSLWSVDPVNPSIHAFTGYPMCIPRPGPDDDPLCPEKNRPINPATGRASTQFRFSAPEVVGPTDPDPMVMAPLVVGDFILYTGQQIGSTFEVNGLTANVGYYTAPGTKPVYVVVDEAMWGIVTPPSADPPETRAVVFTTDQTTPVQWYAEDVDRCTGDITERAIQLVTPQQNAPIGRVVYRMGTTRVIPVTRNVVFRSIGGTIQTKNNLTAGEYHSPIADFVFPEITTFGANADPLAFDTIPFLVNGFGPYVPGDVLADKLTDPPIVGQLQPWPGSAPPPITPTICTEKPATSSATPATGPQDNIIIISAIKTNSRGGTSQVVVRASSDNPAATLKLTVAATTPLNLVPMTKNADGTFSLSVLSKGAQTSVTVTSNLGGTAALAV